MSGVRVAVIDSGIDLLKVPKDCVDKAICFTCKESGGVSEQYCSKDHIGHGTSCARIINSVAPRTKLIDIKIYEYSAIVDVSILIKALRWAIQEAVDVINLSLGISSTTKERELWEICEEAFRKKIIIVASAGLQDKIYYPACFQNVISVGGDGTITNPFEYRCPKDEKCDLVANGKPGKYRKGKVGASFAVPVISGNVSLVKERCAKVNVYEVKDILKQKVLSQF